MTVIVQNDHLTAGAWAACALTGSSLNSPVYEEPTVYAYDVLAQLGSRFRSSFPTSFILIA